MWVDWILGIIFAVFFALVFYGGYMYDKEIAENRKHCETILGGKYIDKHCVSSEAILRIYEFNDE